MSDSMLEAAIEYAARGYAVFPLRKGSQEPIHKGGHNNATTDEAQINEWWRREPHANIGIAASGLLIVDVDNGADWPPEPEQKADLADAPTCVTPRSGTHHYFRRPEGADWKCSVGQLGAHVDIRTDGGYVVAPPSVRKDGEYQWIEGLALDVRPDQLSEPPGWLVVMLNDASRPKDEGRVRGDCGGIIPDGCRHLSLFRIGCGMRNLGLTETEILACLEAVNADRCVPPVEAKAVSHAAKSAAKYEPDQALTAALECHWYQDGMHERRGEAESEPGQSIRGPSGLAEELTPLPGDFLDPNSLGGLLGGFVEWTLRNSRYPQPGLALGAAIALVGSLAGRKICDAENGRTNIYTVGIAPSGAGKEQARQCVSELLTAARADTILGQSDLASSAGLFALVDQNPTALCLFDEIGDLFQAIGGTSFRPSHLIDVPKLLKELYTSSKGVYRGKAYAEGERNRKITQPNFCFYGTGSPSPFFNSLSIASVEDGFIPRLLIFEGVRVDRHKVAPLDPPSKLVAEVRSWVEFNPGGNLSNFSPSPRRISDTKEAEEIFEAFANEQEASVRELGEPLCTIWTRAVEKARKLALIHAASQSGIRVQHITAISAKWACDLARYLTDRLVSLSRMRLADSQYDSQRLKVLRIIMSAGPEGISKDRLRYQCRSIKRQDRDEILKALCEAKEVREELKKTKGRSSTVYVGMSGS